MMKLHVKIEVHLFSEGQLQDDQIEKRKQGFGLYSPEFYKRILGYQNKTINVQFDDQISVGGFEELIHKVIWDNYDGVIDGNTLFFFITSKARYSIDNPESDFRKILDKYLDPESTGCIRVGLYVCEDAGSYAKEGNLNYSFHSHEQGRHNVPHVHVYYDGESLEEPVSIMTGEVISNNPKMPKKYQKQAKQFILGHQAELLEAWNTKTDGLNVDINQQLELSMTYCIDDIVYNDILSFIKHTATAYERTPSLYKYMQEEDLRNALLAALNGSYKGTASGKTFRHKGKTDICIETENGVAFVAECTMWTDPEAVSITIKQLDNYITSRDCKTALIIFVRNKGFYEVLDKVKETLERVGYIKHITEMDKNEFKCQYASQSNPGQIIQMSVMLFNLHFDEN